MRSWCIRCRILSTRREICANSVSLRGLALQMTHLSSILSTKESPHLSSDGWPWIINLGAICQTEVKNWQFLRLRQTSKTSSSLSTLSSTTWIYKPSPMMELQGFHRVSIRCRPSLKRTNTSTNTFAWSIDYHFLQLILMGQNGTSSPTTFSSRASSLVTILSRIANRCTSIAIRTQWPDRWPTILIMRSRQLYLITRDIDPSVLCQRRNWESWPTSSLASLNSKMDWPSKILKLKLY